MTRTLPVLCAGRLTAMLAAGVLACGSTPSLADVKAGVDAWGNGDFPTAIREWQGPANAGDPDAQFNLAQAYRLGRGVPRDLGKAEALFAAAAAKGHLQASDNYGLLLFQRGEHEKAMPYIRSAAARGDARAQYILGLALFNGDGMPKDWVRAYAYVSLAQQAGLPQATSALKQMDQHVSMADRQKSVAVAAQIAAEAEATRARQLAAADLGGAPGPAAAGGERIASANPNPAGTGSTPSIASVQRAVAEAERVARGSSPSTAGADYTVTKPRVATAAPAAKPSAQPAPSPAPKRTPAATPAPAPVAPGNWRLQLGAFGVAGNAEALWARVRNRPELSGHSRLLVPAGKLTKLQATGFASQADAASACARLKAGGFTCLATRD